MFIRFVDARRAYQIRMREAAVAWIFAAIVIVGMTVWWVQTRERRAYRETAPVKHRAVATLAAYYAIRDAAIAHCTSAADEAERAQDAESAILSANLAAQLERPDAPTEDRLQVLHQMYDPYMATCTERFPGLLDEQFEQLVRRLETERHPIGF